MCHHFERDRRLDAEHIQNLYEMGAKFIGEPGRFDFFGNRLPTIIAKPAILAR